MSKGSTKPPEKQISLMEINEIYQKAYKLFDDERGSKGKLHSLISLKLNDMKNIVRDLSTIRKYCRNLKSIPKHPQKHFNEILQIIIITTIYELNLRTSFNTPEVILLNQTLSKLHSYESEIN